MSEWQPYLHDRLIKKHESGFYVIVPNDFEPGIPLCCPVCDTVMRTKDDESSWYEFTCCSFCALTWASSRKKEWLDGWRPAPALVHEAIEQRSPLVVDLIID
jgi:hypothetical protein